MGGAECAGPLSGPFHASSNHHGPNRPGGVSELKRQTFPPWALVVVAAGRSQRLQSRVPKPYLPLRPGAVVLEASLDVFRRVPGLRYTVVVTRQDCLSRAFRMLTSRALPGRVVPGGAEREDSVALGLSAVPPGIPLTLIHDAARPFVTVSVVRRVLEGALKKGAVVPGVAVLDTVKWLDRNGRVRKDLPRHLLAAVQTPQGFRTEWLRRAFKRLGPRRARLTDDGAVVQAAGYPVHVVEGDPLNFKITTPADLKRARETAKKTRNSK